MTAGDGASDELAQFQELIRDEKVYGPPPVDPARRRRRRRRGALVGGIVVVAILALLGAYAGYALSAPVGGAVGVTRLPVPRPPGPAAVALPPEGAAAVSVSGADEYLGPDASGIWASSGGDDPRPIASISKLVTAMVVLDRRPLSGPDDPGPTLTFDASDHALYDKYYVLGATIAEMPTGSSMSEHDALETMLVVSACNYAEAVVEWAFGSQSAFLAATRDWLAANGFPNTRIVEPTGLDARNTSTPSELIALGKRAMADPVIAQIVGMRTLQVPGLPPMSTTNTMLGRDGITGIKTGTLDPSGSNLLYSATLSVGLPNPLTVVGVALGGESRADVDRSVDALLTSIAAGFHDVPLGRQGDEVGTYSTPWGASARMVLGQSASLLTWSDTPVAAAIDTGTLTTGTVGQQVGTATWTAGPNTVTVPVVLDADIAPPDAWWRLTHPFDRGA